MVSTYFPLWIVNIFQKFKRIFSILWPHLNLTRPGLFCNPCIFSHEKVLPQQPLGSADHPLHVSASCLCEVTIFFSMLQLSLGVRNENHTSAHSGQQPPGLYPGLGTTHISIQQKHAPDSLRKLAFQNPL